MKSSRWRVSNLVKTQLLYIETITVLYILLLHVLFQDNAKDTFRGIYRFLYI